MDQTPHLHHNLDLLLPRGPDRRHHGAAVQFPLVTEEGLVLAERRSGRDRRASEPVPDPEKRHQR